jgi:hypothetical protein
MRPGVLFRPPAAAAAAASLAGVLAVGVALTAAGTPAAPVSRQSADAFARKITQVEQHGRLRAGRGRVTPVTEHEVNSYLRFRAGTQIPAGVREPSIDILPDGTVSGRAIVDLDAVRRSRRDASALSPLQLLRGQLEVTAAGRLRTAGGQGRFDLDSAEIAGIPVPPSVLQQVVSYYSRSAATPNGVSLADPFDLPSRIREIRVEPDRVVIVQD